MSKIKQLSVHEAQKIAAGEVVERPANIVKELVENSIDAGATHITLYIEDGGKKLIRIVDNGCGMDIADAQICFDRHATSKITHVNELESITTFGFRGEALASIAAVSKISLITKEENSLEGTQVIVEANTIIQTNSVACTTGTDISVHNLFAHIPARKKFLKTTQTEWRAIQLLFNAFCFDYPHIHFSLFSDDKQVMNCPTVTTIKNRALQLWESSTHNHLLEVSIDGVIAIHGVISNHQHYRYDKSNIYFFVNKRWVKNYQLSNALVKGYNNVIPQGRYPLAAISITIPAHEVDINIHPRKEEVKFLHPRRVEQLLQDAVNNALNNNVSEQLKRDIKNTDMPQISNDFKNNPFNDNNFFYQKPYIHQPQLLSIDTVMPLHDIPNNTSQLNFDTTKNIIPTDFLSLQQILPQQEIIPLTDIERIYNVDTYTEDYRLIGQYNTTYILIEKKDGLFLVDQHAAHERILYELFSQRFTEVATVQLLFPQIINLSLYDINVITPHLDIFIQNGLIIEQCSQNQLIVQSLPVHLKDQSINDIIEQTIQWIAEHASADANIVKQTINNKLQAQMACKAAVKAGDVLTQEKMEQLLRDLSKTANRFSCPHGRPTGWLLSLYDIEKKFKRRT
ncbi:MAG TPA: DNA mismatch repair endonuclease MutL [Candidatus Babeliales bacterium]|nr:DNA mismatch repair endonuclease MutL [Candidatus Babeliales bacterium]